jgi:hypothetical protein
VPHELGQEPERLERDGLAARVGAGEHEHHVVAADRELVADDGDLAQHQHRVPRGAGLDPALGADHRPDGLQPRRQARPRAGEVDRDRGVGRGEEGGVLGAELARQLPEDRVFGGLEAALGEPEPIVELDDGVGLDEHGLPGAADVVHDAEVPALGVGLDGQHVAVVAHGPEPVLEQVVAEVLGADEAVERGADLVVQPRDRGAELGELGVHAARQLARGVERLAERGGDVRIDVDDRSDGGERGRVLGGRVERLAEADQGLERLAGATQLGAVEHDALGPAGRGVADVGDPTDGDRAALALDGEHLLGGVERAADVVAGGEGAVGEHGGRAERGAGVFGPRGHHAREVQGVVGAHASSAPAAIGSPGRRR